MASITSAVMELFRAPVGSSANTMAGSEASARQIEARCSCPPETSVMPWCPTASMPKRAIRASTRATAASLSCGAPLSAGSRMLSRMVRFPRK